MFGNPQFTLPQINSNKTDYKESKYASINKNLHEGKKLIKSLEFQQRSENRTTTDIFYFFNTLRPYKTELDAEKTAKPSRNNNRQVVFP